MSEIKNKIEELKKFTLLKSPPTTTSDGTTIEPSQDELWEELEDTCMGYDEGSGGFLVINEAKKRYRITRI